MRCSWVLSTFAVASLGTLGASPASATPSEACDTDTVQAMAPAGTTVAFAAREAGGCRVNGYVTTTNPGPNKVLFMLALPDNFNGRYVYLGVGGAAGQLPTPPAELFAKGYALAGSDGGTGAKSGADFSFQADPAKSLDFSWRGVHVSAAATQQITQTYYKRDHLHRYISGCSGGGNMGVMNARRFGGQDFDGIIAGAVPWPASLYLSNIYRIASHLQQHPAGWISPELLARASAAILAAYDDTDGAADGLIFDQRNIPGFDVSILRKAGFTAAQVETFDLIRQPYKFPRGGLAGDGVTPGFPVTNLSSWAGFLLGTSPPPWPNTLTKSPNELLAQGAPFSHIMADTKTRASFPGLDYTTIADPAEFVRVATRDGKDVPFTDPMDFSALDASGAKLIMFNGVNDGNMTYLETMATYAAVTQRFPKAKSWLRAFAVPGLLHCRGGAGPTDLDERLLESLVAWVEKGQAPETVVANRYSQQKGLERSFLLCAEPTRAHLTSPGLDPKQAANWSCRTADSKP
jgi:feruloyl esterase